MEYLSSWLMLVKRRGVIYIFCFIQLCSMNVIVSYISFTVRYLFEHAPCNIWAIRVTVFEVKDDINLSV